MSSAPTILMAHFTILLLVGAAAGAAAADTGESPRVVIDEVRDNLLTDGGDLNTSAEQQQPAPPQVERVNREFERAIPDTPATDQYIRQHLAVPLIRAMIWVAGVGAVIGHGLASIIGVGATRAVLSVGLVGFLGGAVWRGYSTIREVAR